jgi:MFS transporter, FSR family, fosmidomycin resistance protein
MRLPQKPLFWSVSLGHMTVDMFNGMGPVMLAFLSAHVLSLSNTQIGFAVSAYQLAGALSQPLFGYLGDRNGGRLYGAGGVAWTVLLLMLSLVVAQITGQFALMLIPYVLAAVGSGAFHPVGAMHASNSDKLRSVTNTSLFFLMGQMGLAIGPALAGFLLDRAATHNNATFTAALGPVFSHSVIERGTVAPVLALGLIAIPVVLTMFLTIPASHIYKAGREAEAKSTQATRMTLPLRVLVLLACVVALRSLINPGTAAFIPRLFQLKGWDASQYGLITSCYWLGGGLAGVFIGSLADRYDSRLLVAVTLLLSAPALFLLTAFDGGLAFVFALATGALSGGSHSLLVVQAQRLIPGSKGFASGAILGFMFTTGAIGSLLIGRLSDVIGLTGAFQIVAGVTIFTGLLGLALPPDKRHAPLAPPIREAIAAGTD